MTQKSNYFGDSLGKFHNLIENPDAFLNSNTKLSTQIKKDLKTAYDTTKNKEENTIKSSALPELIVKNFDIEQIWQQIELQNESVLTRSLTNVSKLLVNKDKLIFKKLADEFHNSSEDEEKNEEIPLKVDNLEDNISENEENLENPLSDNSLSESDLSEKEEDKETNDNAKENRHFGKKSIVDDEFFKLNEMESFLKAEEKKLNDPDSGHDTEDSNNEGSIDLFEEMSEDDEENNARIAKYKEFFVENTENKKSTKRNKFIDNLQSDDEEDNIKDIKSSLELRQERLSRKIQQIEKNAVSEKPWQLKGEITAEGRPQNSLLEEIVEFDMSSRPAPVITEQTTLQLEDIIKQRIKDKAFDSVERKAKPVETPLEYKKKLVLEQEKSKESLAKIYEKEFLEQQAALDPENADKEEEEPLLHKEIRIGMTKLFNQLDALSNFHFTPKPAIPELKIVSNLPAINMEEVAPVAASDAALLAPEEIKNKTKGEFIGKGERTDTDKNRERRNKKQKQRIHAKEKQKRDNLVDKMNPGLGNKYSKEKAKKLLEKVTKDKNIDKMDESMGSKSVKSSKAFFTQLQEEVHSHISTKVVSKKKKNKNVLEAKKIKL